MKVLYFFFLFFIVLNIYSLPKSNQTNSSESSANYTVNSTNVNVDNNPVPSSGENTSTVNQRSQSNSSASFNPIQLNKLEPNRSYSVRTRNSSASPTIINPIRLNKIEPNNPYHTRSQNNTEYNEQHSTMRRPPVYSPEEIRQNIENQNSQNNNGPDKTENTPTNPTFTQISSEKVPLNNIISKNPKDEKAENYIANHEQENTSSENDTPSRFIREREKQRKVQIWRRDNLVKDSKFKDLSNNPSGKKPNANGYQPDRPGHYPNPFGNVKYIPEGGRDYYMQNELRRRNSNEEPQVNSLIRQPPPIPENQSNNNQETIHPIAERNLTDSVVSPGDKSTYGTHPRNDFPEPEPQEAGEKPQPFRPPHMSPPSPPLTGRSNSSPPPELRKSPNTNHGPNYLSARRDEREDRRYTPLPSDDPRRSSSDNNNNYSTQRNNPITRQGRRQRQNTGYENNNFLDLSPESQQKASKNKLMYKPSSSRSKTGSDQSKINNGISLN